MGRTFTRASTKRTSLRLFFARNSNFRVTVLQQYRNLSFADTVAAKRKYCDICRNLPTYGMIFFDVKEPQGNSKRAEGWKR